MFKQIKKIKIHWPSAMLSVLLALTVWFTVAGRERVEAWINVHVEIKDVPSNYIIMNGNKLPSTVEVRLRGPSGLIRNLTGQNIPMLLSLSSLEPGHNLIPLNGDNIPISGAFVILEIRPAAIEVDVDLYAEKEVELTAKSTHSLPSGITQIELIPPQETIRLKGPQMVLEKIDRVEALVSLPSAVHQRELLLPSFINLPQGVTATPQDIVIKALVEGKPKKITVQRSVRVSDVSAITSDLSIKPKTVNVTIQIPFDWDEKKQQLNQIFAIVEAPKNGFTTKKAKNMKVSVQVPDEVKLISVEPRTVKIEISD